MDPDASISLTAPLPPPTVPMMFLTKPNFVFRLECTLAYPLLSWLLHMLVCFKKRPDVECLPAPDVPMDAPIKSKFKAAAVQRTGKAVSAGRTVGSCSLDIPNRHFARHCDVDV